MPRFILACTVLLIVGNLVRAPFYSWYEQREYAPEFLQTHIEKLMAGLPKPDGNLLETMPRQVADMREGFRYYPERQAFKYTFLPRYAYDSWGEADGIENPQIPEPLERRSIWLKPEQGKWRCYAGVKKSAAVASCNDRSIIRGLRGEEHAESLGYGKTICTAERLDVFGGFDERPVYRIRNEEAGEVFVFITNVLHPRLVLHSKKPTVWYIRMKGAADYRIVMTGEESSVRGLDENGGALDYPYAQKQCETEGRNTHYTRTVWDKEIGDWLLRQPAGRVADISVPKQTPVLRIGGEGEAADYAALEGKRDAYLNQMLNTVSEHDEQSRIKAVVDEEIVKNTLRVECADEQSNEKNRDSDYRDLQCKTFYDGKLLAENLYGGYRRINTAQPDDVYYNDSEMKKVPDWVKEKVKNTPVSELPEGSVLINGRLWVRR